MTDRMTPRRRWRAVSIVAAANLAAVGLVAAPSQAQAVSLCSGTAEGFTIAGDLAVPAGESCSLTDVTVTGDVVVRKEGNLTLDRAAIGGDLTVRADGFALVLESSVDGVTALRQAFGLSAEGADLGGGVDARSSGFLFSDGSTSGGEVFSRNGQTVVLSSWLDGDLRTREDLLTDVSDTVVTGRLLVDQAELGAVVCESEVDGDVRVRDSGDLVQLGVGPEVADCAFNVFGGGVTLRDNDASIRIGGNVIRGALACEGNTAAPTGEGNRVRGGATGQCADLAPAVATFNRSEPSLSADSRVEEIRGDIKLRTAEATVEADQAGPADL